MSGFTAWLQASAWAYPTLEVAHIVGIALLLGNLVLLEARCFGLVPALPVEPLARLALGIAVCGFAVVAASGLLMFATRPAELLANRAFGCKMLLVMLAGCNAAWFHGRGSLHRQDGAARALLAASTVIWLAAVVCGRWIAYL